MVILASEEDQHAGMINIFYVKRKLDKLCSCRFVLKGTKILIVQN